MSSTVASKDVAETRVLKKRVSHAGVAVDGHFVNQGFHSTEKTRAHHRRSHEHER